MEEKLRNARKDIEKTRASLIGKIEMLDDRIHQAASDARLRVKRAVDMKYHVAQRPWPMMGMSLAAGYALRRVMAKKSKKKVEPERTPLPAEPRLTAAGVTVPAGVPEEVFTIGATNPTDHDGSPDERGGLTDQLVAAFSQELDVLKGVAVGALANLIRDMVGQVSPTASAYVREGINSAAAKITGQRLDVNPPQHEKPQDGASASRPSA